MKKNYLKFAIFLPVLLFLFSFHKIDNTKSLQEMETGTSLFGSGKYKDAIPHFTSAKTNPDYSSIASRWIHGCRLGMMMDSVRNIADTVIISLKKYEDAWNEVNNNPNEDWGCRSSADCDKGGIFFSNLGIYRGTRADSVRSGYGVQYYELIPLGLSSGTWVKGKLNGQGSFFFDDSLKGEGYVGEYKDNERNGQGVYIFLDNSIGEGAFKDGDSEGPGVQYNNDGTILVGSWKENSMDGTFIQYDKEGKATKQVWKKGTLISPDPAKDK
jgi:hypothetical protein